ncbi:MAG: c-type cytochrome [Pirellulales bacterium]
MTSLLRSSCVLATCLLVSSASAAENSHPVIPGFERFHAEGADSAVLEAGQLLLGELNCTACHKADQAIIDYLTPKSAPVLTNVGDRARPEWIRNYLTDTHATKTGTTMPSLLNHLSDTDKKNSVDALVHFLASTGKVHDVRKKMQAAELGKKLFHQVGCVACHGPQEGSKLDLTTSKPLGDLTAKYSVPALAEFLRNPMAVRHSGRMPRLNLKPEENEAIAQYLLKDLDVNLPANVTYEYYEEQFINLPDFSKLKPKATGEALGFDLAVSPRKSGFALRFHGFLRIEKAGEYRFYVGSDDGSRLLIDDNQVAINNGVHPFGFKDGKAQLEKGVHPLTLEYFDGGGQIELRVEFQGPNLRRRDLIDYVTIEKDPAKKKQGPSAFVVDSQLAEQGQKLFQSTGCASCHQLKIDDKQIQSNTTAKPFAQIEGNAGCLSDANRWEAPDYSLSQHQRSVIKSALGELQRKGVPSQSTKQLIQHTMTVANCYACHQRDEIGGVEQQRNDFFLSTQKEMGDEGRIPPHLNGVGGKLTEKWLTQIMEKGAKDRPYMHTQMPSFGSNNVGHLVEKFRELDLLEPLATNANDIGESEGRIKSVGRHMIGNKVFGCIKCHTFNGVKATGVQGIDMTLMTQRLNREFFHAYLINPQAYRPGTRMPTAWANGKSVMKSIFDGNTNHQIDAIWTFLNDGTKAAAPIGIGNNPIELIAYDEAIMYRNFIQGAGPRAIGVGYPEKGNIAFDANDMRVALIWQGSFMDASRHWNGRGQGFQPPLGDNVVEFATGPSFLELDSLTGEWPDTSSKEFGYKFLGYHLGEQRRPTFRYQYKDLVIEDHTQAIKDDGFPTLTRTISLSGKTGETDLYYRAATGDTIEDAGDGWFVIDKNLRIHVTGGEAIIRKDKKDLLISVKLNNGSAKIVQQYVW